MKEHITIIGAGNLTMSILGAIRRSRAKFTINVVDIDKKKSSQLKKFGVKLNTTYDDKISKSKLILLIVKPKDYVQALKSIDPYVNSQTIILSFIAGISVNQIEKLFSLVELRKIVPNYLQNFSFDNLKLKLGPNFRFEYSNIIKTQLSNPTNEYLTINGKIKEISKSQKTALAV